MQISVVIPTCNRKQQLLLLLKNLDRSSYPLLEIIIVDSGEERLQPSEYVDFRNLNIHYLESEKSVCIQRNKGIQIAKGQWIFLCDDDIEIPADYLQKLTTHTRSYPEAGAVAGLVLQKSGNEWKANYPINSGFNLFWKFIFQLGIWGEINCPANNFLIRKIKEYYKLKKNHISSAGWPVVTDFAGSYFVTPVYGLGASLVKREWLLQAPYDEVLDRHGIGDNYGVNLGFPSIGVHVLNNAFVYHHRGPENRLQRPLQYFRRVLALDYFRKTNKNKLHVKKTTFLWSLFGNLLIFLTGGDWDMTKAAFKSIVNIFFGTNPYIIAKKRNKKIVEPVL